MSCPEAKIQFFDAYILLLSVTNFYELSQISMRRTCHGFSLLHLHKKGAYKDLLINTNVIIQLMAISE